MDGTVASDPAISPDSRLVAYVVIATGGERAGSARSGAPARGSGGGSATRHPDRPSNAGCAEAAGPAARSWLPVV